MKRKSICSNCKNETTCIFLKNAKSAILVCEEFEIIPTKINQKQDYSEDTKILLSSTEYTGLCNKCDYKEVCHIRCESSVIWHCEEYA